MSKESLASPVLFLLFNRPDTTRRVFEEIRRARPQRLYVAADGPRDNVPSDASRCAEAREVLNSIDWPCDVKTLLRDNNLGCKRSVSSAITWFFDQEEEGIILEDDCLPAESFFGFCGHLLTRYRNDERVMMIGGTNHLLNEFGTHDSYLFSRYFNIWGWASWRRVWQNYDITMPGWAERKRNRALDAIYPQSYVREYMARAFDLATANKIDTWDIQFSYYCLFKGGLSAVPRVNLISNIGVVGTHSAKTSPNNDAPVFSLDVDNLVHPAEVKQNVAFDNRLFERQFKKSFSEKLVLQAKDFLHVAKQALRRTA